MRYTNDDKKLTIFLAERIDSMNADSFDDELRSILSANEHDSVTLDCRDLQYISSAGLRVLLKHRKEIGGLTLINVSDEIYEIFDITGFVDVLDITRA